MASTQRAIVPGGVTWTEEPGPLIDTVGQSPRPAEEFRSILDEIVEVYGPVAEELRGG